MSISEKNPEISRILGIDYGKSNVGLALADSETRMSFAYGKIKNDKNLENNLKEIIKKENVKKVVIGIPSFVSKGIVELAAEKLGELLKKSLKTEVFYQNEMFTTKMAQANLKAKGMKDIKQCDDEEAARLILQEWLENNQN
jgi:putative transcription antitermination factor YqgF